MGLSLAAGSGGAARISYFSPNKISVEVESTRADDLVLNQNYHRGWRVESAGAVTPAISRDGLIAAPVEAGSRTVVFSFRPKSFVLGLLLTGAGLLALLPLFFRRAAR